MEFDLRKRDILITEAMKSAKGLVDTYGAKMQDPTFLTLAKMGSGSGCLEAQSQEHQDG